MEIGKLEEVEIRKVWSSEPDFTAWLEENPDVLSNALGIALASLSKEQSAGDFYVDLVGEDESGNAIIVENQFGKSDHNHLGKLVTYLSAFDAKTAVWIVETPRSEHVKAVAWLNDSSSASFYLLKAQAVKIAGSLPAPLLTLIVGPSADSKAISTRKQEFAENDEILRQFWTQLIQKLKERRITLHSNLSTTKNSFLGTSANLNSLMLSYVIRKRDSQVELYIDKYSTEEQNLEVFNHFLASKEAIENAYGGELVWQELPNIRAKRIASILGEGGLDDRDNWDIIQDKMIDAMGRLHKALKPYIANLKT